MKFHYTLLLMVALSSLSVQLSAAESLQRGAGACDRCPVDIRQGPGFWNGHNPYTEEYYDEDEFFDGF